ncbi:hypothetical protein HDU91_001827, partial [Kappamyces sp. JEL0680]
YDSVGYVNCGKEPYSGVDASKHPGMIEYVEQAGDGIFCMRICEAGQQIGDPCNVKNDTAGCTATMGVTFNDGFSITDLTTGTSSVLPNPVLPPLQSTIPKASSSTSASASKSSSAAAVSTSSAAPSTTASANGITGSSQSSAPSKKIGWVEMALGFAATLLF